MENLQLTFNFGDDAILYDRISDLSHTTTKMRKKLFYELNELKKMVNQLHVENQELKAQVNKLCAKKTQYCYMKEHSLFDIE